MHRPVRRQIPVTDTVTPTATGVVGGETVSSGVNPGSSLLLGATGSAANPVSELFTTDQAVTSTSSPTPNTSSSSSLKNSPPSVSTGSVIAITVSVFLVLIGAMFLLYTYIKKRIASRARHPLSRGPRPAVRGTEISRDHGKDKRRNNGDDRGEGKNHSPLGLLNSTRAKSPDSAKFGLFEKDFSIRSVVDEKANISTSDDHHFDPSTMASFANYPVGPVDDFSALSHPHPLARHEGSPPVSWDGRTPMRDPFASLQASVSDTMSPTAVVVSQSPLSANSEQHRWESAEVLIMGEVTTEPTSVYSDASQNPFNDDVAPRRSTGSKEAVRRSNSNPFFNASQHNPFAERSTRSRSSSVSTATAKRSRSYSASSSATVRATAGGPESENALYSLLAALHPAPVVSDEQISRSSIGTTVTSLYTPVDSGADRGAPQAF